MRSAILLGAILIGASINPSLDLGDGIAKFFATAVMVFFVMDAIGLSKGER